MSATVARSLAFAAGFCLMLVELVSSRTVAPYFGVSVYTWTAVIGVTLLGVTMGNFLGGQYADKFASRTRLGLNFSLAGLAVLFSNYLASLVGGYLATHIFSLWFKSVAFAFFVYFPAALLLAAITPQLLKLDLNDLKTAGRRLGSIYAWNTLGSILGTCMAGYFLIALVGTKLLITVTAVALMGLGIVVARPVPIWKNRLAIVAALFVAGDLLVPGICKMETDYYCIRIDQSEESGLRRYVIRLDHLIHSYVTPAAPENLGYGYENIYTNLLAYRYQKTDAFSTFFIGGGGYALPRYLEAVYPSSTAIVTEIDPGVTEANHRFMELKRDTRIQTHNVDARVFLDRLDPNVKYDLVFGDAFNDFSVPYHLTTVEFHRLLKAHLKDDGVYALNIIDDARYGGFAAAMLRTLGQVWKHVYFSSLDQTIEPGRNTFMLIATDQEIDLAAWSKVPPQKPLETDEDRQAWASSTHLLTQDQVAEYLNKHPAPALTDDFAPTDRYLAPVFGDAY